MSDLVTTPWWSIITVVLTGLLLVLLVIRIEMPTIDESGAASMIGLVLTEAIVLYVGYGMITRVTSPAVHRLLVSE